MKSLYLAACCILVSGFAAAQVLSKVPKIWQEPAPHRLTKKEYVATLKFWDEKFGEMLTIEKPGESAGGDGIFTIRITDPDTPDESKQHSLITALHGGPERSGTTACFHLIEWLTGDDPGAVATRKNQVVLVMPIINPLAYFVTDRFGDEAKVDPYSGGGANAWDIEKLQLKNPGKSPGLDAFLKVVDEFQPEAHLDLHGTGLQEYSEDKLGSRQRYQGQTMTEITGSAYSNYSLRPWDWRITEKMIAAGVAAGYPSDRFEADAQRAFWGLPLNPVASQVWRGRPFFYSAQYGYLKYHTVIAALEIGWEESGVARAKGWLAMGNEVWPGEKVPGYPVDRMNAFLGNYVTAAGKTAAARRRSRIAIWQRQGGFGHGLLYPQTDGRSLFVIATTPEAVALVDSDPDVLLDRLTDRAHFDVDALREFIEAGPEIKIAFEKGRKPLNQTPLPEDCPMGFRLRLPYDKPEIVDVRLNGNILQQAEWDGYETWVANGFTQLQINLQPDEIARADGLFLLSVGYVPNRKRRIGWTPPQEVLEKLKK
ncbi:MAG: hypothetical protein P1V20_17290 [Verrucomicrobiales bacterium]|nr:hypothetical protein [Verrucomicrobiales bacterium]